MPVSPRSGRGRRSAARNGCSKSHLFDFEGELYRKRLAVDFIARLRDEVRFDSVEAMTAQMHDDARRARKLLAA